MEKEKRIMLRLDTELFKALKNASKDTNIPVSELIRDSLNDFVDFYDETIYNRLEMYYENGKISAIEYKQVSGRNPSEEAEERRKERLKWIKGRPTPKITNKKR